MEIYCLTEFKSAFEKLKKNNSYRDVEKEIIEYFFKGESIDFYKQGAKITGTDDIPFIKKRISGRGGWRFYYLLIIKAGDIYLMFLHPKKGSMGTENITEEFEKLIYKEVLSCIKSDDLYKVFNLKGKLQFQHKLLDKKEEANIEELLYPLNTETATSISDERIETPLSSDNQQEIDI